MRDVEGWWRDHVVQGRCIVNLILVQTGNMEHDGGWEFVWNGNDTLPMSREVKNSLCPPARSYILLLSLNPGT